MANTPHRVPDAPKHKVDNNPYLKALAAFIGFAGFCFLACTSCDTTLECVYKVVWNLFAVVSLALFCIVFRLNTMLNLRSLSLMLSMLLIQGAVMVGVLKLQHHVPGYVYEAQALLWLPYMLAPTAVSVMVGQRLGQLTALCASVLGATLFDAHAQSGLIYVYSIISLVTGMFSAMISRRVHKREHVLRAGIGTGLVGFVCIFCLVVLQQAMDAGDPAELASLRGGNFFGVPFAVELGVTVGFNFVLSAIIGGAMPAMERIFSISTPISWLEWADMNHPLLKRLQIMAPGTFHHSLMVQRLAEAGAEAIGADGTRAGVCALYHDIGKTNKPEYFTENMQDQANSPHRELTPEASARIIIGHVADGVELARAHGLNRRIVDVIREHHGVTTAYFFHRKAQDLYKEEKAKFEEGLVDTCPDEVDDSIFTYAGPIPRTRESGIVSLADVVESATRSLVNPTEADIRDMIDSVVRSRILCGHLRDSNLTFGDVEKLKESFFATICSMNHHRIAYPKKEQDVDAKLAERRKTP